MKVIENYYGASVFYEEALDVLFPALYQEAIAEHSVQPVDRPELDVEQIGKGQELKFSVEVFVRPDVKLGEYKHLGIEKEVAEVTDDDVNAEIERARDRASRYVEITDRPSQAGRPGEYRLRPASTATSSSTAAPRRATIWFWAPAASSPASRISWWALRSAPRSKCTSPSPSSITPRISPASPSCSR